MSARGRELEQGWVPHSSNVKTSPLFDENPPTTQSCAASLNDEGVRRSRGAYTFNKAPG